MNVILEISRYIIMVIIGVVLINWYEKKKGWKNGYKTSLKFILIWRTFMFFIVISVNLLFDFFLKDTYIDLFYTIFYPVVLVIIIFFLNIFLGVKIFKFVYKREAQESIIIILIIVIIEIILDSILLYLILIPESLGVNFNI